MLLKGGTLQGTTFGPHLPSAAKNRNLAGYYIDKPMILNEMGMGIGLIMEKTNFGKNKGANAG